MLRSRTACRQLKIQAGKRSVSGSTLRAFATASTTKRVACPAVAVVKAPCLQKRAFHASNVARGKKRDIFKLADIGEGITECEVIKWCVFYLSFQTPFHH